MATGRYLAWIDDDEAATPGWLSALWDARSVRDVDAVFGPVIPVFPENSYAWPVRSGLFERPRYLTGTVVTAHDARTGNALVKADWHRMSATSFDDRLANFGGEDFEFFSRIEEQGARFEWCDEAEVFEVVPIERQRLSWILERNLRVATLYWRIRSGSFAIVASRALFGLALFAVLGMAGLVAAPFGFHRG